MQADAAASAGATVVVVVTHDSWMLPLADRAPADQPPETVHVAGEVLFEQSTMGDLIRQSESCSSSCVRICRRRREWNSVKTAAPGDYFGEDRRAPRARTRQPSVIRRRRFRERLGAGRPIEHRRASREYFGTKSRSQDGRRRR